MRYRPFARTGIAVSTISLALDGKRDEARPGDWRDLMHAAFEEGINTFELINPSPALLEGFAEGISAVKRSLLFIALRADPEIEGPALGRWAYEIVQNAHVGALNLLAVEAGAAKSHGVLSSLRRLREADVVHNMAVAGTGSPLEEDLESGFFDAIIAPFNLLSSWRDRNLVRRALESHMGVIAADPCPVALDALLEAAVVDTKPGWFRKPKPLAGAGTYAFLESTPSWSPEQLCLSYPLTEPAVATVQAVAIDRKHLAMLSQVADRDMPSTVSAQIEMARFSAETKAGGERRSA
jgi:aryl-alcohol dehydrogenase-like predicted oxidoreductase